jgi:hypothetical protein
MKKDKWERRAENKISTSLYPRVKCIHKYGKPHIAECRLFRYSLLAVVQKGAGTVYY